MTSKVSSWIPDQLNHSQDNVLFFKQIRTGAILVLIVCLFFNQFYTLCKYVCDFIFGLQSQP